MCQEGELEGSFEQGSTPGDDCDDDIYDDGDDRDAQVVISNDGDDLSERRQFITTTIIIIIIISSILIINIITIGIYNHPYRHFNHDDDCVTSRLLRLSRAVGLCS